MLRMHEPSVASERGAPLEELRRPALIALSLAGMAAAWVWTIIVANFKNRGPIAPPLLFLLVCVACLLPLRVRLLWRSSLFLLGFGGCLLIGWRLAPEPAWLYYGALVVVVAGLLSGPPASMLSAALLSMGALLPWSVDRAVSVLPMLGLLWAAALASWLSSRNLYTALAWAMDSQARAWKTATEVQRRREQLRRTLDSLHHAHAALARTNRELEAARRDAEEARRLKSEFAANISHELRTPLSIILGFTEIMSRSPEVYHGVTWSPTLRRDINEVRRNARYLSEFVDDILDLSRMDALRMPIHREPTDLATLVQEAIAIIQRLLRDKPVQLHVSLPPDLPQLLTDKMRIRQVLINLLSNACRFTERGSITVSASADSEQVTVSVADSGSGIPEQELERIFDEYHQVSAWRRPGDRGKGLGLAIAKGLVQLHGGRIWAESKLGVGSIFHFTLPLSPKETSRLSWTAKPGAPTSAALSNVLVLDEEETGANYLRRHLDGYSVSLARDVGKACRAVAELHPQAVVVSLPPGSCFCGSDLRALSLPSGVPLIGCSLPSWRWVRQAERFSGYLSKPVMSEVLMALVRQMAPAGEVMVVDDERGFVQFVQRSFQAEGQGHRLRWSYDAVEALQTMREHKPALVLLDLVLPGMDGFALADAMRADPDLAGIPVVAVSGASLGEEALAMRGDTFIVSKSCGFQGDELVNLIRGTLATVRPDYLGSQDSAAEPLETGTETPAS